jgi:elongation factor P
MQLVATQIRTGMILEIDGELYKVTDCDHVTPGKGVACMQTKLKNVVSGKNLEKRFRSADRVERAEFNGRNMQYLYADQEGHVFMDNENYEQVTLSNEMIGEQAIYLTMESNYDVQFHDGIAINLSLPKSVDLTVTVAPPEIKKATASASLRPVELENGMTVNAPSFIKEGDRVKINTDTNEYIERVK